MWDSSVYVKHIHKYDVIYVLSLLLPIILHTTVYKVGDMQLSLQKLKLFINSLCFYNDDFNTTPLPPNRYKKTNMFKHDNKEMPQ